MNEIYTLKNSLITKSEEEYYAAIKEALPYGYLVFPQINLAAIIKKKRKREIQKRAFQKRRFFNYQLKLCA